MTGRFGTCRHVGGDIYRQERIAVKLDSTALSQLASRDPQGALRFQDRPAEGSVAACMLLLQ